MRKFSWRMARCYYPSWKHSHSALASYTLLEMLGVFGLCVAVDLCHSHEGQFSSPFYSKHLLHRAGHAHLRGFCLLVSPLFIPHVNFSDVSCLFVNCGWILDYSACAWRLSNWFALWSLLRSCRLMRQPRAFPGLLWNSVYQLHFVLYAQ